jgi:valyl-tRNA synthetase
MAVESVSIPPRPQPKDEEPRKGEFFQAEELVKSLKELKDAISQETGEPVSRSRRYFHERDEDPIDRLRLELLQRQIDARAAEAAAPKPRWSDNLGVIVVGMALTAALLSAFFSLNASITELRSSQRELAGKLVAVAASVDDSKSRYERWEAKDERSNERVQNLEAALTRIEAQLERLRR